MLIIHLFSIFTIKTTRALAALTPVGLLIVKTLTNVLLTITYCVYMLLCLKSMQEVKIVLRQNLFKYYWMKYVFQPKVDKLLF